MSPPPSQIGTLLRSKITLEETNTRIAKGEFEKSLFWLLKLAESKLQELAPELAQYLDAGKISELSYALFIDRPKLTPEEQSQSLSLSEEKLTQLMLSKRKILMEKSLPEKQLTLLENFVNNIPALLNYDTSKIYLVITPETRIHGDENKDKDEDGSTKLAKQEDESTKLANQKQYQEELLQIAASMNGGAPGDSPAQPQPQPQPQPNLTIPQNIFNTDNLSTLLQTHYSPTKTPGSRLPKFPPDPKESFIYEDRTNIRITRNNTSFIGRINHTPPPTTPTSATNTTLPPEKTTIANIFHESDKVILQFPPNQDGSIKPTQKDWIVDFLGKFLSQKNGTQSKAAENQVPVVTAHGFTPEDLMNLLEKIHEINSNPSNENKILLKIDCKDATEEYALVKHNIEIHNKNIVTLINSPPTHENPSTLAPLLKTLPNNHLNPSTGYPPHP